MKLSNLNILQEDEERRIINLGKGAELPFAADSTIAEVFRGHAGASPDVPAVVFGSSSLTYRQLDEWSDRVAGELAARHGVGPERIVALCFSRSIEMIVAIFAVWKSGGAYVPIDPEIPDERVRYMLSDTVARVVLCNEVNRSRMEGLSTPSGQPVVLVLDAPGRRAERTSQPPTPPTPVDARASDLAYVIYTSGTTGKPKGVMIENRSVVNHVTVISTLYGFHDAPGNEVMLQALNYAFDGGVVPMVLALLTGNTLLLVPDQFWLEGEKFTAYLKTHGVTHINGTPTLYRHVDLGAVPSLKRMIVGGEALDVSCFRKMRSANNVPVFNEYGPTEATISTTSYAVREYDLAIGRPQSNASILVLNQALRPVPVGGLGEVFLTGPGLARGYLNQPELTAEKFIKNLFQTGAEKSDLSSDPEGRNARLYRTGDVARWRSDGVLEYVGRNDSQIKVRGFLVELAEIESVISSYPGVEQSVVLPSGSGEPFESVTEVTTLVGYYVSEAHVDADRLVRHLERKLPSYMVPHTLLHLTSLPMTLNGKLDTRALRELQPGAQGEHVAPRTELEASIRDIVSDLIGVAAEGIGMQDDLFGLGLNSILVVKLITRLKNEVDVDITVPTLFMYPTIAELVANSALGSAAAAAVDVRGLPRSR
jgi:amino acid adenylation domain-containing protein